MGLAVGQVARLAGVTVRTLHHYDEIGLLSPRARTRGGYRQYDQPDLARLQRILGYRELGFGLDEIVELLAEDADPTAHLRRQRSMLLDRIRRLQRMVTTVERTMDAQRTGVNLSPEEMLEVFGEHDPAQYAEEAEERWGDTDAYRQSMRRTSSYTRADWQQVLAEQQAVTDRLVAALRAGLPADGAEAMDAAEAHRQQIGRDFYDCGYDMHVGLGEMYLSDPRFTRTYEEAAPDLARYLRDAIVANAARAGQG